MSFLKKNYIHCYTFRALIHLTAVTFNPNFAHEGTGIQRLVSSWVLLSVRAEPHSNPGHFILAPEFLTMHIYFSVAQWWRTCVPVQEAQETQVRSLGWEDLLEEDTATHSSILAWRIPRTEEPFYGSIKWSAQWNFFASELQLLI